MATTIYCLSPISLIVQYLTSLGIVAQGATLNVYVGGSVNTPQVTYTDSTGTTQNANPMTLSSAGRPAAASGAPVAFWTPSGVTCKLVVSDAQGNFLVTLDNLQAINDPQAPGSTATNLTNSATGFGADLVANAVRSYDIFSSMRAANVPVLASGQTLVVEVQGANTVNDGGGGEFIWSATSAAADDSATVIKPNAVSGAGRYLRLSQGVLGGQLSIASATTTDLGSISSHVVSVTGAVTINSFGTSANLLSPIYFLTFAAQLTLTFNSVSMILPGAANIVTAPNDTAIVQYLGGGNWKVLQYVRAVGTGLASALGSLVIVKPTDQSVTNSTVLVNDTALTAQLAAGATYLLQLRLQLLGVTATGAGYQVKALFGGTLTSGGAGGGVLSGNLTAALSAAGLNAIATAAAISITTNDFVNLDMVFVVNAAGVLNVQFAQASATGNATSMKAGSTLILTRIA